MTTPERMRRVAARGRRASEATMLDTCAIERPSKTPPTIDPATAAATPQAPTAVYAGPCRLKDPATAATETERADTQVTAAKFELETPLGSGPYEIGDVVRMTSTDSDDLWALVEDRRWLVTTVGTATFAIHQVLALEEVTDRG